MSLLQTLNDPNVQKFITPNQGIWNSRNNMLIIGGFSLCLALVLTFVLSTVLPYLLSFGLSVDQVGATTNSTVQISFFLAIFNSLFYGGGQACVQHFALRLVLYRAKLIPWNFVTFFQQAEERLFIQRTGGSYIFIHRYLQEHFANLRD